MLTLLIIADDYTGALDTGVQFAAQGIKTLVITDADADFRTLAPEIQVLVINAETRHLRPDEAFDTVYRIGQMATALTIPYLYKKTDSALRGNIGSELEAALQATGTSRLHFLPSFPTMNRRVKQGTLYIDELPVHQSVFGKDPFEPVTTSYIPDIIALQSQVPVFFPDELAKAAGTKHIVLWNAETDSELRAIGQTLADQGQMQLTAGCAGFASILPELLNLAGERREESTLSAPLLVLSGSVNQITQDQVDYAEQNGFTRLRLQERQKFEVAYWSSTEGQEVLDTWQTLLDGDVPVIIDSLDTEDRAVETPASSEGKRERIAESFGQILKGLLDRGITRTCMIIGGDTLLGAMRALGVKAMAPRREVAPGTVLSEITYKTRKITILSKSGGFGQEDLLPELAKHTKEDER